MGEPGTLFPRRWSVYRWLSGERANRERVTDLTGFAIALAEFLSALYAVDTSGGPRPGFHNFFRGAAVVTYDGDVWDSIEALGDRIDAAGIGAVWAAAADTRWTRAPV